MSFLTLLWLTAVSIAPALPQDSIGTLWKRLSETNDVRVAERIMAEQPVGVPKGFGWLRIYQLTRDPKAGGAAENIFQDALEASPENPWLQFGYGEALALKNPKRFPLRASKYLIEALRLDSLHVPAAAALARLALASREKDLLAEAQSAATRITKVTPNAELLNLMTEIARETRDAAALRDKASAAAAAAPSSARARFNLAIAQLAERSTREAGYRTYLAAADLREPEILKQISKDLSVIGSGAETPKFENPETRPSEVIEKFWDVRSVRDGRTRAERVAEHYRRIAFARDKFFNKRGLTVTPDALNYSRDQNLGYDDRGVVYIRYGEPNEILRTSGRGMADRRPPAWASVGKGGISSNANAPANSYFETWIYQLPQMEEPIIFHFQLPLQAGRGYVLSLIPGCGAWLENHYDLNGQYQLLATKCGSGSAPSWSVDATLRDMNLQYKEAAYRALKADAFPLFFRNDLAVDADVYAFRSATGDREYTLAVAVPVATAHRESDGTYRYGMRLIVADTVKTMSQQIDSAIVYRSSKPLGKTDYLRTTADFRLADVHAPFYRLSVTDPADSTKGSSFGGSLPTYLTKGFDVSDIVLADTAAGGNFQRGNVALQVIPSRLFAQAKFRVFYEIYDMAPGSDYRTTIKIDPKESGVAAALRKLTGQNAISLSFEGTKSDAEPWRQQEVRTIDTALAPGTYELTITVQDLKTGALISKSRMFRVVGRG